MNAKYQSSFGGGRGERISVHWRSFAVFRMALVSPQMTVDETGKMKLVKTQRLRFCMPSIPAKPLAQAKLKCGGFSFSPRSRHLKP
jgi:hypothetical protein